MGLLRKYFNMIRQDLRDVMSYRCGLDELNNFIMLVGFVLITIALFSHKWIFTLLGSVLVVLCYIRVFSKKLDKRKKENDFYMKYMGNVVRRCGYIKQDIRLYEKSRADSQYVYFACKNCRQVIRVPKGKHKLSVRCPKCSTLSVKKT